MTDNIITVINFIQGFAGRLNDFLKLQFVLSGFSQHLAPRSFWRYNANTEDLVKYAA